MVLWRISNHRSLSGAGGVHARGRWHTKGRPIVYCAQSPAAALLEILVHAELALSDAPIRYRLFQIAAPDTAFGAALDLGDLPTDWIGSPALTRRIGDAWLSECGSALLLVPSAVVARTTNVLINPLHPAAEDIAIVDESDHVVDRRLLR